jgi:hypothetical protein
MRNFINLRRLALAALATATAFSTSAVAHAAAGSAAPAAPNATDVSAARTAALGSLDTLGRFFAAGGQKPQGSTQEQAAAAKSAAPRIDSATVPVFYLSPAFVADTSTAADVPVASLAFLATDAVSANGTHASVWTAPDPHAVGTWRVVNIASGSDETAFAAQAGPGATAFEEPQIGAWYALKNGRVLPLDDAARQSVGDKGMTLADYHKLVRSRYADKMAGSAYDRNGVAGGFTPRSGAVSISPAPTANDALLLTSGITLGGLGAFGLGRVLYRRLRNTH